MDGWMDEERRRGEEMGDLMKARRGAARGVAMGREIGRAHV